MDFNFDIDTLKKPYVWAVLVPSVLTIWALVASATMFGQRREAIYQRNLNRDVQKNTQRIAQIRQKLSHTTMAGAHRNFQGIASARDCARIARISEIQLSRAESYKPQRQKDGSVLHRETYKLNKVRLLRIVQFIDYAERNFSSLTCTRLSITPVPSKTKDVWDANISIQYLVR